MTIVRTAMGSLLLGTSFLALAGPAAAESFTVTGISISPAPGFNVAIPTVIVEDGNITETDIRTLFSLDPTASLAAVADLDAASIVIPEITVTQTIESAEGADPFETTLSYRDISLINIADGLAETVEIGSSVQDQVASKSEAGKLTVANLNIGGILGFLGYAEAGAADTFASIYGSYTGEGGALSSPLFSCTYGSAESGSFEAKPMTTPFSEFLVTIANYQTAEDLDDEQTAELVGKTVTFVADLLMSIRSEASSIAGFDCSGSADDGTVSIKSGPLDIGGFEPGIYPDFSLAELAFDAGEGGNGNLGSFTFKSIDFRNAIEVLRAAPRLDKTWFETNWRRIIPVFEGLALSRLALDVPNPESSGERIQLSMADLDLTLGAYVNAIPSDVALSIADLVVPLPPTGEPPLQELRARGITSLTVDAATSMIWNDGDQTITVRDLLLDAAELGSIRISGTLGNATSSLFADSVEEATIAAQMLTIKDLTITLDDGGIGTLIVQTAARDSGQPEGALRMQVSGLVQGMTLAILGNTDEALVAAQSLGRFLGGNARNVKVTLTATDPAGLGLGDFAAIEQDPTALAGKVTIVAEASGDPVSLPEPTSAPADSGAGASTQGEKLDLKN